jgi:hypothetical protein
MDIFRQAEEVAFKRWVLHGLDAELETPGYSSVPTGSASEGGLIGALSNEDDEDRVDFFKDILDAVMPVNTGGWTVAAVYQCETVSATETFIAVIWRIKSGNISKTLIEFKAFLLQWDEENDRYVVAKNRKL